MPAKTPDHDHPVDPQRVAAARERLIDAEEAARPAGLLGLLADPALALEAIEDSVGYGLRVLRTAGLVTTRKDGRVVYYRLSDGFPEPLRNHCSGPWSSCRGTPTPTTTDMSSPSPEGTVQVVRAVADHDVSSSSRSRPGSGVLRRVGAAGVTGGEATRR